MDRLKKSDTIDGGSISARGHVDVMQPFGRRRALSRLSVTYHFLDRSKTTAGSDKVHLSR